MLRPSPITGRPRVVELQKTISRPASPKSLNGIANGSPHRHSVTVDIQPVKPSPLYRPDDEHDACGVGFVANVNGKRSYETIDRAITGLNNLAHRGAIDADAVTGDGAGLLTQIPFPLFGEYLQSIGKPLFKNTDLAVCMVFLAKEDEEARELGKRIIEEAVEAEGLSFLAWREVPVNPACLGRRAEETRPAILQALVSRREEISSEGFERKCFLAMKMAERRATGEKVRDFYIVSFSSRTVTYKGLLNASQLRRFFIDLRSPQFTSAFAMFHQRFATNTIADWRKAQPYRLVAHNGEINTIRGNRNLMRARESSSSHGVWGKRFSELLPIVQPEMSDSASFDNVLQLITLAGRSSIQSVSMMVPHSWEKDVGLKENIRDFYRFHSTIMEPWDGPAAMVFSDGRYVGAALDRSGLRPLRYKVYEDGTVVMASEAGVVPDWGSPVVTSGRLGPGRMVAVDLRAGRIMEDEDRKEYLGSLANYGWWCRESIHNLHKIADKKAKEDKPATTAEEFLAQQIVFDCDRDEMEMILRPMIELGSEPLGSMGDDTPLAILSRRPRLLYGYFKQLFAQVTNPAIDPIRESLIMSLTMYLGGRYGLFEGITHSRDFLELESPLLFEHEFESLSSMPFFQGRVYKLETLFDVEKGADGLRAAVRALCDEARQAVSEKEARIIILSDRGVCDEKAAISMLLAAGAVNQSLSRAGLRLKADIVVETGEARDVHQFACLLGYGANAVYPYLALDLVGTIWNEHLASNEFPLEKAHKNYRQAVDRGILKIMSKMGISTLFSYHGAQVFEALGLGRKLVKECFFGTPSPIGGISYREIGEDALRRHRAAFTTKEAPQIGSHGYYKVNKKGGGEFHGWNPKVVSGMNNLLRKGNMEKFTHASEEHPPVSLKDLLKIRPATQTIPLDEVEPIEDIRRRFTTAGMSLGALSPEAHECLAIAMNHIGGKSNSGEGGEDPRRFTPFENGESANSAIKQVASGRFGVTAEYLANAREIEIKVAQGAKPGEGGQLPGHKVSPMIAQLRHSVPGVTLISPPPHHDIYSIEDLAQLVFDLKEVNPRVKVCVKLVACSGVGTVAVGVAKAYADTILISGHEGGTGASPVSSIKNAGSAWEIGIAEAHQLLMMGGLRDRVTLRTDGGFKTGRDVVVASLLGAEEYNFGTAALLAAGCAMFRVCHLNSCPVGVATQREDLRAKFRGKPENVVKYFNAVAEEVRQILASLGYRSIDEIVGRTDLLEQIEDPDNSKSKFIDLSGLLHDPDPSREAARYNTRGTNDSPGHAGSLDHLILQDAREAILGRRKNFSGIYKVKNVHRNIGTRLAGEVAYLKGGVGLAPGTLDLTFKGSAGQSFGAFLVPGIRLKLIGETNDYVGKGMNGGEIVVFPDEKAKYEWHDNFIVGNTCLYGATGGHFFAAGRAGQRFAVRNSGAIAVVEGAGDHGCEYMTGGAVAVLGPTGRNFGAGMSGGLAFVFDSDNTFKHRYNPDMVDIVPLEIEEEIDSLQNLLELYQQSTGSPRARQILKNWKDSVPRFFKVVPHPPAQNMPKAVFRFGLETAVGSGG